MFDLHFFILIFIFLLAFFLSCLVILKNRKKFHVEEEFESETEVHDYEYTAKIYEKASEGDEGDDIRDIYGKRKKKPYQPKSYRGTDIEVSASESKKDAKALQQDDLPTIDLEDLIEEEPEEVKPEPPKEVQFSGIAAQKDVLETTVIEIKQNYLATGKTSALNNLESTVNAVKSSLEKKSDKGEGKQGQDHGKQGYGR